MTIFLPDPLMFARLLLILLFVAAPQPAGAQVAVAVADSGDTGWMLVCALLVMLAALPGLALRSAGLANVRSALALPAQIVAAAAAVALAWGVIGYSLAFGPGNLWLGGGANLMLRGLGALRTGMTVPESAFALFQLAMATFATCLLPGAVAERLRIGWVIAFAPLWLLIVYVPTAHAVWGGGWLAALGVMDFAGGLVMHGAAGFSALALLLILGRRRGNVGRGHSQLLTMAGGALMWVGWAGMVGGWALGATEDAASAILNAHLAACAGVLGWMALDVALSGTARATGAVSGALAGLVAISAAAPLAGPGGAMLIGLIGAATARIGKKWIGRRIDDSGDIFAIHGLGGVAGALALPLFVQPQLGGVGFEAGISLGGAMLAQGIGVVVVGLWASVGSAIVALLLSAVMPGRSPTEVEAEGLDAAQHRQQGWDFR